MNRSDINILVGCEESQAVKKHTGIILYSIIAFSFVFLSMNIKYHIVDGKKECGNCHNIKSVSEFYKHNNSYRSYCKSCNSEHTKAFRSDNKNIDRVRNYSKNQYYAVGGKEKKIATAKKRLTKIKQAVVDYKGGKCFICGYNKCLHALEFHHNNPQEKDIKLNSRGIDRRKSIESLKKELDKCTLLCANCHREAHYLI